MALFKKLQFLRPANEPIEGRAITIQTQSDDAANAFFTQKTVVAEFFPFKNIGNMDLYGRRRDRSERIGERDAGVRKSPGIDDDAIRGEADFLQFVDQKALVVALKIVQFSGRKIKLELLEKLRKAGRTIDFRLAFAQKVEVGAVDDPDLHFFKGKSKKAKGKKRAS